MSPRTVWAVAGVLFTVLAAVTAVPALRMRWAPRADFDVVGVLWVLQNLPRLLAYGFFFAFLGLAVYAWARTLWQRP